MNVAYQGEKGAYSYIALKEYFKEEYTPKAYDTFKNVFEAINSGEAVFGVLPIENSYAGSVLEVYDLFNESKLYIIGEQLIKINHSLMGIKGGKLEDIREVFSHEQAFMQCSEFLLDYPHIKKTLYFNTALSAKYVSESKDISKAAIASLEASKIYNLQILRENINSSKSNTTRFIIISKNKCDNKNAKKASVSFTLEHKQGTLLKVLEYFNEIGLNMVKIESRPTKHTNFEYVFYVDFEGENTELLNVQEVSNLCNHFRILGIY